MVTAKELDTWNTHPPIFLLISRLHCRVLPVQAKADY
jgi:hypothetical protein